MLRNSTNQSYRFALEHFERFLLSKYPTKYNIETILKPLSEADPRNGINSKEGLNLYTILDEFVSYLLEPDKLNLTAKSIKSYLVGVRSYLAYYDIDVIPSKFRRKVKVPREYKEDEKALDAADIRKILLACNNKRLKTYLLVLASGGFRAMEALAIRIKDIDFSVTPTKIHVRKEYAKTKVARDIYISDEATKYLKHWLDWKYRDKTKERLKSLTKDPNDLVFTIYSTAKNPETLYIRIISEFEKLLQVIGLDDRKEGKQRRMKITLHSFRRYVKTTISDLGYQDYSEWFLGHAKNAYYTKKELERREIYSTKCMKSLEYLDYATLDQTNRSLDGRLRQLQQVKDAEIQELRQKMDQQQKQMVSMQNTQEELKLLLKNPRRLVEILDRESKAK
jgi:integrase